MYAINHNKLQRDATDKEYFCCFDLIDNEHSVIMLDDHAIFKVLKDDCILKKKNIQARPLIEGLLKMPNGYKRARLSNILKNIRTNGIMLTVNSLVYKDIEVYFDNGKLKYFNDKEFNDLSWWINRDVNLPIYVKQGREIIAVISNVFKR